MKMSELKDLVAGQVSAEVTAALEKLHDPARIAAAQAQRNANPNPSVPVVQERRFYSRIYDAAAARASLVFGGVVASLGRAKGDLDKAQHLAEKSFADLPEVKDALVAGTLVDGGALLSPTFSDQVIDLLTPRTVVRKHISTIIDLSGGAVYTPRLSQDVIVTWGGEISKIKVTKNTFDQITMRPFEPKVIVPFSNTLLSRGGPRVANLVSNAVLRRMAIAEDQAFLRSKGTEHRPQGLRYQAPNANIKTMTATPTLQKVFNDLGGLILALMAADVPMTAPVWYLSPRTAVFLQTLLNSQGIPVFKDEMARGTIWGIPFEVTTSMPDNLGGGTESEIILTDADEIAIGQAGSVQIGMSTDASFVDDDGNVVSAFQQNLTLMRVIDGVDIKAQHTEAIAVLTGVTWAPGSVTS